MGDGMSWMAESYYPGKGCCKRGTMHLSNPIIHSMSLVALSICGSCVCVRDNRSRMSTAKKCCTDAHQSYMSRY